jgi:hypothetical protein
MPHRNILSLISRYHLTLRWSQIMSEIISSATWSVITRGKKLDDRKITISRHQGFSWKQIPKKLNDPSLPDRRTYYSHSLKGSQLEKEILAFATWNIVINKSRWTGEGDIKMTTEVPADCLGVICRKLNWPHSSCS